MLHIDVDGLDEKSSAVLKDIQDTLTLIIIHIDKVLEERAQGQGQE